MARDPISPIIDLTLAPVRVAGRLGGRLVREVTGGGTADEPVAAAATAGTDANPGYATPKPLDDATIARKVESAIFRDRKVAKGKVDVNVAQGAVWLRGEVKTPDLVTLLEARARGSRRSEASRTCSICQRRRRRAARIHRRPSARAGAHHDGRGSERFSSAS